MLFGSSRISTDITGLTQTVAKTYSSLKSHEKGDNFSFTGLND